MMRKRLDTGMDLNHHMSIYWCTSLFSEQNCVGLRSSSVVVVVMVVWWGKANPTKTHPTTPTTTDSRVPFPSMLLPMVRFHRRLC